MALSTTGAPSFSLWALALAFLLLAFGFTIWTAATRAANKRWRGSLPIKANGGDTSTVQNIPAVIASMREAKARALATKALVLVLVFGAGIGADQIYRRNSREYTTWKAMADEYSRSYAAWLAQHPQYQQDKVNK